MSNPLLEYFRSGPPAPAVALLPDAYFFARTVPVEDGADAAAVAAQAELTLETMSPFPLNQLYYGHYWVAGASQVLVYAAYRRRFTVEQTDLWTGAEWVAPAFASVLGMEFAPATTVLLPGEGSLTAISWDKSPVPRQILPRILPPEATDEQRQQVRDELVREIGGTVRLIEFSAPPQVTKRSDEGSLSFQAGDSELRLSCDVCRDLDVRPKEELAQLRRAQRRDLFLWRAFLGMAAAIVVLLLGEVTVLGGRVWQKSRQAHLNSQRPVVEKTMTAQTLANRIDELSTKRLLPFEMITMLNAQRPKAIQFVRTTTVGLYGMEVDALTSNPSEISAYKTALGSNPAFDSVEIREERSRDQLTTFILHVKFKPEAMKASTSS